MRSQFGNQTKQNQMNVKDNICPSQRDLQLLVVYDGEKPHMDRET